MRPQRALPDPARLAPVALLALLALAAAAGCAEPEGDDDTLPPANHVPEIVAEVTSGPEIADPWVSYLLVDADGDPCRVDVEWSADGFEYHPATRAAGDPTDELAASAAGLPYIYQWDATDDLAGQALASAWLRFTAHDAAGRGPSAHVQPVFAPPGASVHGDLVSATFATELVPLDQLGIGLVLLDLESDESVLPPRGVLEGGYTVTPGVGEGEPWSYAFPLPEVAPEDHYQRYSIEFGIDSLLAAYVPVAWIDPDGDRVLDDTEAVAATSLRTLIVALDYAGDVPVGAPEPGWYSLAFEASAEDVVLDALGADVDLHLWANDVLAGEVAGQVAVDGIVGDAAASYRLGALTCTIHGVADELTSAPVDLPREGVDPPQGEPLPFGLAVPDVPGDHLDGPYLSGHHYLALESLAVYQDANGNGFYDGDLDPIVAAVHQAAPEDGAAPLSEGLIYVEGDLSLDLVYLYAFTGCGGGWSRMAFDAATGAVARCDPLDAPVDAAAAALPVPGLAVCAGEAEPDGG